MSLEDLMALEVTTVTSVARRPQRLAIVPSAIQVIGNDEIRRSGATNLPEALRLATNLHVAQVSPHEYAISARGFNNSLANKMLVLIDGRAVYTPLYAGVFWDVQDVLLADVDRIEVVSGPGATLWGANAVNGVISVTTRKASETQGWLVEGGGGTTLQAFESVRYGGRIADDVHVRVYEKAFHRDEVVEPDGVDRNADWDSAQGGFRLDWDRTDRELWTLQGDIYRAMMGDQGAADTNAAGGNVIGRWTRSLGERSDVRLQAWYDRTHRAFDAALAYDQSAYEIDVQHRLPFAPRNDLVYGVAYRLTHDRIRNAGGFAILPEETWQHTVSGFAQDEIELVLERLWLTVGSKAERNHYTGLELQPSARMAWRVDAEHLLWGAVSRAVRTPSRLDVDLYVPATPPHVVSSGSPDFESEKVIAYELGWRVEHGKRFTASLAGYYNDYDDVRSVEQNVPPSPGALRIGNGLEGHSYGAELTVDARVTPWLRVRGGYAETRVHLRAKPTSSDTSNGSAESADPQHRFLLHPSLDLGRGWEVDAMLRAISEIENQEVPGYAELDLRLGWRPSRALELSLVGQNLLQDHHAEFGTPGNRVEIERAAYVKVAWTP